MPCNVIAEEILTDHPKRYRAMLVESANPAHSLADGPRMREALAALELARRDRRRDHRDRAPRPLRAAGREPVREGGGDASSTSSSRGTTSTCGSRSSRRRTGLFPRRRSTRGSSRRSARCRRTRSRRCARPWPRAGAAFARALRASSLGAQPAAVRDGAGAPLPHDRRPPARPARGRRRALGASARSRAAPAPASLARAGFDGDPVEPADALFDAILAGPSARRLLRRRVGRRASRACARRAARSSSRSPSSSPSSTRSPAESRRRAATPLPVRALRRRAPLVHRQHDHPQPRRGARRTRAARCA